MTLYNEELVFSYNMTSEPFVLINNPIKSHYIIPESFEIIGRPMIEYKPKVKIPFYKKVTHRIYTYYKNIPTFNYNTFNHPMANLLDIMVK